MMKETGAPRENHWPAENQWQTLSHEVVSPERELELTMLLVIGTDCMGSCGPAHNAYELSKKLHNIFLKQFICQIYLIRAYEVPVNV
jgi:homoserine acetyltransferase